MMTQSVLRVRERVAERSAEEKETITSAHLLEAWTSGTLSTRKMYHILLVGFFGTRQVTDTFFHLGRHRKGD